MHNKILLLKLAVGQFLALAQDARGGPVDLTSEASMRNASRTDERAAQQISMRIRPAWTDGIYALPHQTL